MTQPSGFISVDAALLAKQAEKLDGLRKSIDELAQAISHRPTREELAAKARRDRIKRLATIVLVLFIAGGFYLQQVQYLDLLQKHRELTFDSCVARNEENGKLVGLLTDLSSRPSQSNRPRDPRSEKIVAAFIESLKPVDCGKLLSAE